jgi:multidrug transporter EmrE-like cation transporter
MIWLVVTILLGALGQFFLKTAADSAGNHVSIFSFYTGALLNYRMFIALLCYGISFLIWIKMLALYELSFARPFVGIGYVITALFALFFLGEKISLVRWLGMGLIVAGIAVMSLSK